MNKDTSLVLKSELLWWCITSVIFFIALYPIYSSAKNFPFWLPNSLFILTSITLTRYIFMLKHTPLRYIQWVKVLLILGCIPLTVYLVQELHAFQIFVDEVGVQTLYATLDESEQRKMVEYTKTEYLFFGVFSILATIIFPFRMLISFWRTYNRGTT